MAAESHSRLVIHFVVNFATWQKQKIEPAPKEMTEYHKFLRKVVLFTERAFCHVTVYHAPHS